MELLHKPVEKINKIKAKSNKSNKNKTKNVSVIDYIKKLM